MIAVADLSNEFTFTRTADAEFVWVCHPPTGGTAQIPIAALPFWAARGWEPCDAPDEIDPTRAHLVEARVAELEQSGDNQAAADLLAKADEAAAKSKSGRAGTSSKGSD